MFIGIDLGGTTIKGGVVNSEGEILFKKVIPTNAWGETNEIVEDIISLVKALQEELSKEALEVIGVGVPGMVTHENSYIETCANINLSKTNLKKILEREIGVPTFIDNDANVAAIAEYEIGSLKKYQSGMLITLGTGVGGGIIINNEVIRGSHGIGAEIGHMVVGENFYDCNCGRNGCLETFASASAINEYAKKLLRDTSEDSVLRGKEISAKIVFDGARTGDQLCEKVINRFAEYLSKGIVNFINILDPEAIALGGGISNAGEYLIDLLEEKIKEDLYTQDAEFAKLLLAELKNDAGIVGAGFMAKRLKNKLFIN